MIVKDSKEEKIFVNKLIRDINIYDLFDINFLKNIVLALTCSIKGI